ncbi:hypothetical protein [Micromonospora maritima]|uniref:hypothetical protein n=1 Tax=Micromonospora maritima TaxID=986711 RepID=UPI00157C71F2|nr:hypothetical protein [Micromonospora maritima]
MGRMKELSMAVEDLRALGPIELAELGRQLDLVFPSGRESPGAHFLASVRDMLADKIEKDGGAPDPDEVSPVEILWDVIPDGRNAWDVFLDLEVFRTKVARQSTLTMQGVRSTLNLIGCDLWRELLDKHIPDRFYL